MRRAVRMLGYAADTIRGTALAAGRAQRRPAARRAAVIGMHIIPEMAAATFLIWATVTAPGDRVRYLLTAAPVYGAGRLVTLGVRRLRGRRAGRT